MRTSSQASICVLQNAWQSKPDRASSDRPSSVAVAAPFVKSIRQCGETKAILRIGRSMVVLNNFRRFEDFGREPDKAVTPFPVP